MTPARTGAAMVAAALLAVPLAQAQDEAAALRAQVEQKLRLAARLIADAPTHQRVAASGDTAAATHLDEGRVHLSVAESALAGGDLAAARRAADEALRHLGMARRLAPDAAARQAQARRRHDELLASVERLLDAWRARLAPQGAAGAAADSADLVAALGLVDVARQQAGGGHFDEARQALASAESHVLAGMQRLLGAATLDYTQRAGSPREEFQQELARHEALAELVPIAVRDLRPRPEALALIERYGGTAGTLRGQALQRLQAGEIAPALADLRSGTLYLQRALLAAGVATPEPTGSPR